MNKYIIIPSCSDLNRGDQALVWETKRIAEQAGFCGEFYLTSERNEPIKQSIACGFKIVCPILEHPSRKFKNKENISYTKTLKIKWGIVAVGDFLGSLFLLFKPTRFIAKRFLTQEKKDLVNLFEEADAIFMKGGGLLQTYGGLSSTYSMYFWTFPILFAHKLNIPVYIMPNSFGPFKGPFVKSIAKKALKKCRFVSSRENLSLASVKNDLGLEIYCYPDLAFALKYPEFQKEMFFDQYDIPLDRKTVAVTMRPYRFPEKKDPVEAYNIYKNSMAQLIEWLYDNSYMPVIVEHTLAVNSHENDGACIKEVTEMVDSKKYRIVSNVDYNCRDLKALYGMFDYIIGTRFHSVIFSFSRNVPGIAISYTGNKATGIMHDIGLDDYVIKIENVNFDTLKTKFEKLILEEKKVREMLIHYNDKLNDEYEGLIKTICDNKE